MQQPCGQQSAANTLAGGGAAIADAPADRADPRQMLDLHAHKNGC